jgi:hypothetical protein
VPVVAGLEVPTPEIVPPVAVTNQPPTIDNCGEPPKLVEIGATSVKFDEWCSVATFAERRAKNENTIDPAGTPVAVASVGVDVDDDSIWLNPSCDAPSTPEATSMIAWQRSDVEKTRLTVAPTSPEVRTFRNRHDVPEPATDGPDELAVHPAGVVSVAVVPAATTTIVAKSPATTAPPSPVVGTTIGSVETCAEALSPAVANARKLAATSHPPIRTRRTGRTRQPESQP